MEQIFAISFDNICMAAITCLVIREAMILGLPDRVAGPGGWLINTCPEG